MCIKNIIQSVRWSEEKGKAYLLQIGDAVSAILLALEAREVHLGFRDVLLRVQQVLIESTVVPLDTCRRSTQKNSDVSKGRVGIF